MTKHKHAELIHAWADGAEIELYSPSRDEWRLIMNPQWSEHTQYRIADPYRDLKEAEKAGKTIQLKFSNGWKDLRFDPEFDASPENYRIKPDTVKMWQWIYTNKNDYIYISSRFFKDEDAVRRVYGERYTYRKAPWTEIAVEE